MADVTPYTDPADHVTVYCEGAVAGGTFVAISGPKVGGLTQVGTAGGGTSGLTTSVVGVAEFDGAAAGTTTVLRGNAEAQVLAGAAITAGQKLTFDSSGRAIPAAANVFHAIASDDIADTAYGPAYLCLNSAIDFDVS